MSQRKKISREEARARDRERIERALELITTRIARTLNSMEEAIKEYTNAENGIRDAAFTLGKIDNLLACTEF